MRTAKVRGKAILAFSPERITVTGKADQLGMALLLAVLLTVVSGVVMGAMVSTIGWGVSPGFLMWYLVCIAVVKKSVKLEVDPRSARAMYDAPGDRCSLETRDGLWVTFRTVEKRSPELPALLEGLKATYGERFDHAALPRYTTGDKIAIIILGFICVGTLLSIVIAVMAH